MKFIVYRYFLISLSMFMFSACDVGIPELEYDNNKNEPVSVSIVTTNNEQNSTNNDTIVISNIPTQIKNSEIRLDLSGKDAENFDGSFNRDGQTLTITVEPKEGFFVEEDKTFILLAVMSVRGQESCVHKIIKHLKAKTVVDRQKPIIVLNGADVNLTTDEIYVELGATARDNIDGNLTENMTISGTINIQVVGTYIVKYDVKDSVGNMADTVRRIVTVLDGNNAPVVQGASYRMNEDTNLTIALDSNDSDRGAVLKYRIVDSPANGSISIVGGEVIYMPNANYFGLDGFTFEVRDEFNATSNVASVNISISDMPELNAAPVTEDMNISMQSNMTSITFELNASDLDIANTLTYTIVEPPVFGTWSQLGVGGKNITYVRGDYTGNTSFTYSVNDGTIDSNIATVYIKSNIPNSPPTAYSKSVNLDASGVPTIILDANDTEGNPLVYRIVRSPSHGTLSLSANQVIYVPKEGYTGNDSFKFVANDGIDDSNNAVVYVTVGDTQLTSQLFAWCKVNDVELWETDGTTGGTQRVKDISVSGSAKPQSFVKINNTYFFVADDGVYGRELWKSQGTAGSTVMVKDIETRGDGHANPHNLIDIDGTLFFVATKGGNGKNGTELWRSDGTTIGTQRVKNINLEGSSFPKNLTNVNGMLYFTADDGLDGRELWRSNGLNNGTKQVNNININGSSNPQYLTNIDGVLYFSAEDNGRLGRELWYYNTNISDVASKYKNRGFYSIRNGVESSNPKNLFNYNGTLVFSANDGVHGYELWKHDGLKVEIVENYAGDNTIFGDYRYLSSSPHSFTVVGGALYFSARQYTNGENLRKIDSINAPIKQVKYGDNNKFGMPNPKNLINVNDTLFFSTYQERIDANNTAIGEIFQGTVTGYNMVHSNSRELTNYGIIDNELLFKIVSPKGSETLWISNVGSAPTLLTNGCTL